MKWLFSIPIINPVFKMHKVCHMDFYALKDVLCLKKLCL